MAVTTQPQPFFIVDLESERNTAWPDGSRVFSKDTSKGYILIGSNFVLTGPGSGGPGAATWGSITGTLSSQTDLGTALSGKASTSHATTHVTSGSDEIAGAVANGNSGLMIGTDKAKLNGIAAGATVGADWNTNVSNKPTLGTLSAVNDAPSDSSTYGRNNGTWAAVNSSGLTQPQVMARIFFGF